ncbi:DUF6199 family natural product biosynthesis protein [Paenibacillus eucommiae]|uniref:DUF6199 domain-containing protein n=1 Tax=Paenibacillus eucommiae TaxID=1355755 RepID=A0ABS4IYT8_9BACL|nr:DUF6199 family natural product biosynthesis protein [Paenibacillus eucommiae]MBP1992146.1 hypothetical protein [Paenibacillus eucommiae]
MMMLFLIVFFLLGLIGAIYPKAMWYIKNWWKFDGDVEISEVSLLLYRLGGIFLTIVSIVVFINRYV